MVSLVSERRAAVWVPVLVFRLLIGVCPAVMGSGCVWAEDLRGWRPLLSSQSVLQQEAERVVLQGSEWTWLVSPERRTDVSFEATVQVDSAATQFDFFGSGWSAWPDPQFGDRGFEAGVLLRGAADASSGYRVQLSTKYPECALVRYPDGGYVLMDGGNVISRHAGWFVCIQWWSWGVSCAGAGKRGLGA